MVRKLTELGYGHSYCTAVVRAISRCQRRYGGFGKVCHQRVQLGSPINVLVLCVEHTVFYWSFMVFETIRNAQLIINIKWKYNCKTEKIINNCWCQRICFYQPNHGLYMGITAAWYVPQSISSVKSLQSFSPSHFKAIGMLSPFRQWNNPVNIYINHTVKICENIKLQSLYWFVVGPKAWTEHKKQSKNLFCKPFLRKLSDTMSRSLPSGHSDTQAWPNYFFFLLE